MRLSNKTFNEFMQLLSNTKRSQAQEKRASNLAGAIGIIGNNRKKLLLGEINFNTAIINRGLANKNYKIKGGPKPAKVNKPKSILTKRLPGSFKSKAR